MTTHDLDPSLTLYIEAALGRKAIDLAVLDIRQLTSFADVFIICSGRSNRQVSAIAEHIKATLRDKGIRPLSVEGMTEGQWVLMDYGHILIHIFLEPVREFYDLEGFWSAARRIAVEDWVDASQLSGKTGETE